MQLPTPERSHLPVSHCRAPLSHLLGHSSWVPRSAFWSSPANTCGGSGRTAESGHLRAGSQVPAAGLPGGGARGCCPRCRRRGADAVAMVMELRSCPPLSATAARPRPPGSPGEAGREARLSARWRALAATTAGDRGPSACARASRLAPAGLGSPPRPCSSPSLAGTRPDPGAQRALAAWRARPAAAAAAAAGWPGSPQPCAPPRGCASRLEARRPPPGLGPLRGEAATAAWGPGRRPGSQTPPARPPGLWGAPAAGPDAHRPPPAGPGREHAQSPQRELASRTGSLGCGGEEKGPPQTPGEGAQMARRGGCR